MKKIWFLWLGCCCMACSAQKPPAGFDAQSPVVVYKTKQDYSKQVPVLLSDDKQEIQMYPAPSDLYLGENLALPTQLAKGYWLDNRGIGKNVAFLNMTYADYAKLPKPPSISALKKMIIDKNPLSEFYNCGKRGKFKRLVPALNRMIRRGKLSDCAE